jgi:hypothetical protein
MGKRVGIAFLAILAWQVRTAQAQEPAAPQGPVSYWKFDEATGTTASNSVVGAPDGTHQGGVTISTNVPPLITYPNTHSLVFDGTSGVVNVPNFGTFTAMSVSVWIYRTGTSGGRQSIVSFKETGGGFVLCLNETNPTEYSRIWLNQGGWQNKENATAIPLNSWVHLAATYASGALKLYVGGVEQTPQSAVTGNMTQPNAATGIGARNSLDQNWFPGQIDDVRIYSRALTPEEVAVLAAGCPTPTALATIPGGSSITLNWTAPTGAAPGYTYNVKRSDVPGGPYTTIAPRVSGTTYVDTPPLLNTTYYYVVSAVSAAESGDCGEVSGRVLPLSLNPSSPLFTNENGATATFKIQFNMALGAGQSIDFTVTSSDGGEGQVSGSSQAQATAISFTVNGPQPAGTFIPITVKGIDDAVFDGPQNYTVTVAFTSTQNPPFGGFTIPPINCTNNDNDTPGVTINRTSGLLTSESGGTDQFTVVLNTQPTGPVTLNLSSSNTLEGTVSPASLVFTTTGGQLYNSTTGSGGWNQGHIVTVTGVDDAALDFAVAYSIVTADLISSDPGYSGMVVPDVACSNLDNEVPPELPAVWGGGGCGLLGLEGLLLLLASRVRRRV